jgi:TolB-like protein/tetratricopeptide (TPR) repeat protein
MNSTAASGTITLKILGEFEVRDGTGQLITVTARKNQALLAALALAPSCAMTRARIAGLLWSDRGEDQARTSLRQALAALRKDLGDLGATLLSFGDERVRLDLARIEVDAIEFRRLAKGNDLEALRKAKALLRGNLLADLEIADPAFESWLSQERRRLDDITITLFDKLCEHESGVSLVEMARRLVDLDPTREPSHRRLMLAYAQMGERAAALHQYDLLRNLLRDEFDTVPEGETETLRRRLLSGQFERTDKTAVREVNDLNPLDEPSNERARTASLAQDTAVYERPSVAVLPFLVMGSNSSIGELADGLTEDVITALSHIRAFRVIARNTMFTYKNRAVDVRMIGTDVGARYVLEGSIRHSGDRFRFTAQLIESDTGHHVWADRFDRAGMDLFDMQDQITAHIVTSIQTQIIIHEGRERGGSEGGPSQPAQLLAQSWQKLLFMSVDSLASSKALVERALALDGKSTLGHRMMAVVLYHQAYMGYVPWTRELIDDVYAHAKIAVQADDADEYCYWAMEQAHLMRGEHDLAMTALERALQINGNCSIAIGSKGTVLAWAGDADASIKQNTHALQLNRHDPSNFYRHFGLALARYLASQYAIALEHARIVHQARPDWWLGQLVMAASLAHLDKDYEARRTLNDLQQAHPDLNSMLDMLPFAQQRDRIHLMSGLRKAGLERISDNENTLTKRIPRSVPI